MNEMSGDNSDGTTNIVTKIDSQVLKNGYFHIMNSIYSPKLLYPRIKTFLEKFTPTKTSVLLQINEVAAFFKTVVLMGLNFREAKYYWSLLYWTVKKDIRKVPMAITLAIYGYHFRTITAKNMRLVE